MNFLHVACLLAWIAPSDAKLPSVRLERTPNGGIQPQALVDAQGTLHLIYFKGTASEGDLYYVRRPRGAAEFSNPLRVNSQAKSAVAVGTVRGGQLAVAKTGRVHVVWFGSNVVKENKITPLCYARLNDAGTAFEPQRNLIGNTLHLDGGPSVAADQDGRVFVVWHALKQGLSPGEKNRQVFVARSQDDGRTFSPEVPVGPEPTGACPCCSIKAFVNESGHLGILFRSAATPAQRDVYLLASIDHGKSFSSQQLHPWKTPTCPMSTYAFTQAGSHSWAAWETANQIYVSNCSLDSSIMINRQVAPSVSVQKHPSLAADASGNILVAWTEGTGWQKGGALAWQILDKLGKPVAPPGRLEQGISIWGLPSAVATDQGFLIFH